MSYQIRYQEWLEQDIFDEETKKELNNIQDNLQEIEDRFYKDLEFGTGGLRGVIGAGTNRMNRYTVGRATQGLASFISKKGAANPSVVIAFDSRRFSKEFAAEAAAVLNGNGIKVYVFEDLRPTPELSFAVRELRATAGIVVTASHNPPEYNGYKVYWSDGAQIVSPIAEELLAEVNSITDFSRIKRMDSEAAEQQGLLKHIGQSIDDIYIDKVKSLSLNPHIARQLGDSLSIVYTPLHGTGNLSVRRVLSEMGFANVTVVPEQELPDSNFSTVKYPNPEEHDAFALAIKLAKEKNADVIIGTDPDCDRVGAVVKNTAGEYVVLTGNQTGALLIDYMLSNLKKQNKLNEKSTIINTVVTGKLGEVIARSYGVNVISVLTGFKYIGEKIKEFKAANSHEFVFGYEESYGYLAGDFVRDKDAVSASMLICEMTAYYKQKNMSLYEAMLALYSKYGYYKEGLGSIAFKGKEGMESMRSLINNIRQNPFSELRGVKVAEYRDYMTYQGVIPLPKENMLCFILEDHAWFCIRPSGTEPKLKLYFSVTGSNSEDGDERLEKLKAAVLDMIES
ncbi:MAG: phosphoglucomutase [Clostridiales bacterium GWB2_37_7]|nr:MAG: phosphoglucomutase [Clostridiales bacterium GWB2_37_7]